jgi:hypothetical protein
VLLLVGLVLAGCGSEPVPDQLAAPAVLPSPSASAPPVVEASPPPPVAPAQSEATVPAAEPSPAVEGNPSAAEVAGVEQFVRDYYTAANDALATGDVTQLEAFSIAQCEYCRDDIEFIKRNTARGTIEGSRTTVRSVTVQGVGPELASVMVDLVAPDGRVVSPSGETVVDIDNGDGGLVVHALFRTPSGWRIAQVIEA